MKYQQPMVEVVKFSDVDVIMTSYEYGQFEVPEQINIDPND